MCDLESFKKDLIRIRKEMIELFKSKKLNQDNIKNIQDYFKIKTSDGLKVNFNLISIKEVERIAKENKPKMHLGHTIEAIQMSKVKNRQNIVIPPLERERIGLLSSSLNYPSGARLIIEIEGEKMIKNFPLRNERIPAGSYEAVIENPNIGVEKKINLTIEENKKHFLD